MSATVIGTHARVLGSILVGDPPGSGPAGAPGAGHGDLVVDGVVEGDVRASGQLTLGRRARVEGEIHARDVRIAGVLHRSVSAAGVIHLLATAEVRGDLAAARVIIDDGAVFEGQVRLHTTENPGRAPRGASPIAASTTPTRPALGQVSPAPRPAPPPAEARIVPATPPPAEARIAPATPPSAEARIVPELSTPGRRRLQRRVP